ncbi:MAG: KpsF/GutQ family sugar-phosphate isomerase [Succinivibrionaceae bacterium]|nr:KpsF/GutQ family sugar-phosphate isomerase [Succinivibrionaceae bacterium]
MIMNILSTVFNKEIFFVNKLKEHLAETSYKNSIELLYSCKGKIIITGVGKSGHIASKIAATMASTGTPAFFVHPGEACHGDLGMIEADDLIIAISHSGESSEIMTILPICKRKGIKIITITSNPNSSMAKIADIHLCTYVTEEAGPLNLAPTSSTTVTLVLGDALAIALAERRNFTKEDFAASHPGGALGKRLLILNENIMHTDNQIPLVKTNQTVAETIIEITEKKLGFAIVINEDNNKLVGIFTDGDLRRTLAQNIDLNNTKIGDVAHTNCITVRPYEKAADSLKLMQDNCINGLVVISDDEQVLGAINIHDLIAVGIK